MDYQLCASLATDDAVQLAVYASTRADELAQTDWSDSQRLAFVQMQHRAQQQHYAAHFPQSTCHLIVVDGEVAGRLWVDPRGQGLHILDITVLPAWRGRGLGTRCLRDLARRASALTIQVEIHNPARRWYERLGFTPDGQPRGLHQPMVWHVLATEECPS